MRTVIVVGTRPNLVKLAAVQYAAAKENYSYKVVHTGQHYTNELNSLIIKQLGIRNPDIQLNINHGKYGTICGECVNSLYSIFSEFKFDLLIAIGDVDSSYFAALAAAKRGMIIAHVEAGLRTGDRSLPEEVNRVAIDSLSTYFFATEYDAVCNLINETCKKSNIYLVGNTMIDTLIATRQHWNTSRLLDITLPNNYIMCTIHRQANTESVESLRKVFSLLNEVAANIPVLIPLHPRTKNILDISSFAVSNNIIITKPFGYLDFVYLMNKSSGIITDSGGVQEEAAFLKKKCATLRGNTERPITVQVGSNKIFDPLSTHNAKGILDHLYSTCVLDLPFYWDGNAGNRIIRSLMALN